MVRQHHTVDPGSRVRGGGLLLLSPLPHLRDLSRSPPTTSTPPIALATGPRLVPSRPVPFHRPAHPARFRSLKRRGGRPPEFPGPRPRATSPAPQPPASPPTDTRPGPSRPDATAPHGQRRHPDPTRPDPTATPPEPSRSRLTSPRKTTSPRATHSKPGRSAAAPTAPSSTPDTRH
jgi:hypothetical protein